MGRGGCQGNWKRKSHRPQGSSCSPGAQGWAYLVHIQDRLTKRTLRLSVDGSSLQSSFPPPHPTHPSPPSSTLLLTRPATQPPVSDPRVSLVPGPWSLVPISGTARITKWIFQGVREWGIPKLSEQSSGSRARALLYFHFLLRTFQKPLPYSLMLPERSLADEGSRKW